MDWAWATREPSGGSSNGIQRLRAEEDDDLHPFSSITAVDPGGSTGICTIWYWEQGLAQKTIPLQKCLLAWQADCLNGTENEQTLAILRWFANRSFSPERSDMVIEDFILRSAIKGRELLSPVRIGHKVDYQLWRGLKLASGERAQFEPYWQSPGDAKSVMTDERLKLMAMYTPGPDHARDATRHAIMWLRKHRVDLLKAA
ncbi:RuvC-like resolvase [Streptomyces phage ShakeNBake]|nr:RuvC-like resolvase [Streptomyces phage PHTowN]QNO12853.1 RuvC-like resolvase [Streptomyces phage ShakeNBake]